MNNNIFGTPPKIIMHYGDLKNAEIDGKTFYPTKEIFVPNMGTFSCIDYGNHFIFRDTRRIGWTIFCTCGSPAAVLGYNDYKYGTSINKGQMIACLFHAGQVTGNSGRHADGSQ